MIEVLQALLMELVQLLTYQEVIRVPLLPDFGVAYVKPVTLPNRYGTSVLGTTFALVGWAAVKHEGAPAALAADRGSRLRALLGSSGEDTVGPRTKSIVQVIPSDEPVEPAVDDIADALQTLVSGDQTVEVIVDVREDGIVYGFANDGNTSTLHVALDRAFPDSYHIIEDRTIELPSVTAADAVQALTYSGAGDRTFDYVQPLEGATGTTPNAPIETAPWVLPTIVDTLDRIEGRAIYHATISSQAGVSTRQLTRHRERLQKNTTSPRKLFALWWEQSRSDEPVNPEPSLANQKRLDRLDALPASTGWLAVNARIVTIGDTSTALSGLTGQFTGICPGRYSITGETARGGRALPTYRELLDGAHLAGLPNNRWPQRLIAASSSPAIVANTNSLPHFTLFDTDHIAAATERHLAPPEAGARNPNPAGDAELDDYFA